jgi:hypothetical protein
MRLELARRADPAAPAAGRRARPAATPGWCGPLADLAKQRAVKMAAALHRYLQPPEIP